MKLSRLIDHAVDATLKALVFHPPEPGPDAISSKLWAQCQDIAEQALQTTFVQGLGNGTLNPNQYGQYTVQDCAYCAAASQDYHDIETLAAQQNEPTLAAFAKAHYTSYDKYVETYLPSWHVGDASALVLNEAGKQYIAHERAAVKTLHPIYGILGQLPCERLWPWLAQQLRPGSPKHNVYQFWINENANYGHMYLFSNYMDQWFGEHPDQYNEDVALAVIRGSVIGELNMFRAACGESLTPMPQIPGASS